MLASLGDLFDVPCNICYLNTAYGPPTLRTLEARAAVARKS